MAFILKIENLEPGDVILTSESSKTSKAIRLGTKGDHSHAMLYIGNSVIHATLEGVYSKNPQRLIYDNESDVTVLRINQRPTEETIRKICSHARRLAGGLYSKREAALSIALNDGESAAKSSKQFCSRLVAQSFRAAGIDVVVNSDYCTPEDIRKSSAFKRIDGVVRPASEAEIQFSKSDDPVADNQRMMFSWLNKTRDIAKKLEMEIQHESDVAELLQKHPDLDSQVCEFLEESGYLKHYDYDMNINPHRYKVEAFMRQFGASKDMLAQGISEAMNIEPGIIVHHVQNLFSAGLNYRISGLRYNALHEELYRNILRLSLLRVTVLKEVSVQVGATTASASAEFMADYLQRVI